MTSITSPSITCFPFCYKSCTPVFNIRFMSILSINRVNLNAWRGWGQYTAKGILILVYYCSLAWQFTICAHKTFWWIIKPSNYNTVIIRKDIPILRAFPMAHRFPKWNHWILVKIKKKQYYHLIFKRFNMNNNWSAAGDSPGF